MPAIVSMLRGVNVGAHNRVKMDALRAVYESLALEGVRSYVQSGNIVFQTKERDLVKLGKRIEDAIEQTFGFRPDNILRSAADLRDVIVRNPFAARQGIEPSKLLVTFLEKDPGAEAQKKLLEVKSDPEEMVLSGRELFIYFPNGMARPKLKIADVDKALKTRGTGRNWNTVLQLSQLADEADSSSGRKRPAR